AEFFRRLRRPQSGFARFVLNRRESRERNIFMLGKVLRIGLERQHILLDKGAGALPQILDIRRKRKIHLTSPSISCASWQLRCRGTHGRHKKRVYSQCRGELECNEPRALLIAAARRRCDNGAAARHEIMPDSISTASTQFTLDPDQTAMREVARAFAAETFAPNAIAWDEAKHFPVAEMRKAAALGMGGIFVAEDF